MLYLKRSAYCLKSTWLLLVVFHANAQHSVYTHYTAYEGLASNTVYCIFQDNQQFIWIGTEVGVSRFDGTNFINYTEQDGLPDNEVIEIFSDHKGRIWFVGFNGKLSYYSHSRFYPYKSSVNDTFRTGLISGTTNSHTHTRWLWGEKLVEVADTNKIITYLQVLPDKAKILQFEYGGNATYLFFLKSGIYSFKDGKKALFASLDTSIAGDNIRGGFTYNKDTIIFYTNKEIYLFKYLNKKCLLLKKISLRGQINYAQKMQGAVYVAFENNGLFKFSSLAQQPNHYEHYLPGQFFGRAILDKENNLWVATYSNGIYCISPSEVVNYNVALGNITAINGHKDKIWIGLNSGTTLSRNLHTQGGRLKTYKTCKPNNRVRDIVIINDITWIGTDYCLYKLQDNKKDRYFISLKAIKSLSTDHNGNLVISAYNGVFRLNTKTYKTDTLFFARATAACEDMYHNTWIGTPEGLFIKAADTSRVYKNNTGSLSHAHITCIKRANNNIMWVATSNQGVFAIFENMIYNFTNRSGLDNNFCKFIFIDSGNTAWIVTNSGISKIILDKEKNTSEVYNYSQSTSLYADNINQVYLHGDSAWAATNHGLVAFSREWRPGSAHVLPVYITLAKDKERKTLYDGQKLIYSNNSIDFNFIGISFKSKGKIHYKYRLYPLEKEWKSTASNHIEYSSVQPGAYIFQVFARDYTGKWSRQPAQFHFQILLPFWKTNGFYWSVLLFIIIIIVLGIIVFQRVTLQRSRLQRKMMQLELEAMRARINPHFIFNCLNSIQYYFTSNDKKTAQHYLSTFSKLIRNTLEYSKRPFISLQEEMLFLESYIILEQMKMDHSFDFNINSAPGINSDNVEVPSMLFQIYVENAIRHGLKNKEAGNGLLNISFSSHDDYILCCIEDNGVGIKQPGKTLSGHHSLGMEINRERITILNSIYQEKINIEVIDKLTAGLEGSGTIINLFIPMNYERTKKNISHHC